MGTGAAELLIGEQESWKPVNEAEAEMRMRPNHRACCSCAVQFCAECAHACVGRSNGAPNYGGAFLLKSAHGPTSTATILNISVTLSGEGFAVQVVSGQLR